MANQGRSDIENGRDRGPQTGSNGSEWERGRLTQGSAPGQGYGPRDGFYTRAEHQAWSEGQRGERGHRGEPYGRAWDATIGGESGRGRWQEQGYPGRSVGEHGASDPRGYGERFERGMHGRGGMDWERNDRDLAYGDYGHPGEGNRRAYGDMGFGEPGRGTTHVAPAGYGAASEGGLLTRFRRWRHGGQRARDVMTRNPRTARPSDTLQQIAQLMVDEDTGVVPIVEDNNRLVGLVTDRDIVCRMVARGIDLRTAKAADVMTDEIECVTEQHELSDVLRLMSEHQVRRVPVVARGDRLVGIISMADIAREADLDEELQDTFEDISSERGFWAHLR